MPAWLALAVGACLSMAAAAVSPDLRRISEGPGGQSYLEVTSLEREGHRVVGWVIADLPEKKPVPGMPGKTFASIGAMVEIDCTARTLRTWRLVHYAGQMGEGEPISSSDVANPPVVGTLGEQGANHAKLIDTACASSAGLDPVPTAPAKTQPSKT